MKNYVQIYSFEDICSDSINVQSKCVVGTKNPFENKIK